MNNVKPIVRRLLNSLPSDLMEIMKELGMNQTYEAEQPKEFLAEK